VYRTYKVAIVRHYADKPSVLLGFPIKSVRRLLYLFIGLWMTVFEFRCFVSLN